VLASLRLQTVDPTDAPDSPEAIRIEFVEGVPVKVVNHADKTTKTDALDLFLYLNEVGS
jgi:argininosuccinate synthase